MALKALLLCAGRGKRFAPYTKVLPKPLLPFLNLPLVSYSIHLLKSLGVLQFVANLHSHPGLLKKTLKARAKKARLKPPVFSYEPCLLGSAGTLHHLRSFFEKEEHFYYLNGDSLCFPFDSKALKDFYTAHRKSRALVSFLCTPSLKTTGVLWTNARGRVGSFFKKSLKFSKPCHFVGLALFSRKIFKWLKAGDVHIFKDVLHPRCLHLNLRAFVLPSQTHPSPCALWLGDMNQLSTYLKAHHSALQLLLQNRPGPGDFLRGVLNDFSPGWDRFCGANYFSATPVGNSLKNKKALLFCGKGVKGLHRLSIKGFAVLGSSCVLSPGASVCRSVLNHQGLLNHELSDTLLL